MNAQENRRPGWPVRAAYALFGLMMAAVLILCLGFSWMAYAY